MKQLLATLAAVTLLVACDQQDQGGTGSSSTYQVPGSGTSADTGLGAATNQTGARTNAAPSGGTAVPQPSTSTP